jgi:hypothetical protein
MMTFSIKTFRKMALSMTTLSMMTLFMMTLSITTLSMTTLIIMTFRTTINEKRHITTLILMSLDTECYYAKCHLCRVLSMLSVTKVIHSEVCHADYHYAECHNSQCQCALLECNSVSVELQPSLQILG